MVSNIYIYSNQLQKGKYMFINVVADKPDPIMMLTFMPIYNYISYDLSPFSPNPTDQQLLSFKGDQLRLDFPVNNNSIIVDMVTLNGHAEISCE